MIQRRMMKKQWCTVHHILSFLIFVQGSFGESTTTNNSPIHIKSCHYDLYAEKSNCFPRLINLLLIDKIKIYLIFLISIKIVINNFVRRKIDFPLIQIITIHFSAINVNDMKNAYQISCTYCIPSASTILVCTPHVFKNLKPFVRESTFRYVLRRSLALITVDNN